MSLLFGVDRFTITRAVGEIRTRLAQRRCAVPGQLSLRLRTLADAVAYAQAEGLELRLDATGVQVRRPQAGRGARRAFISGKKKQSTMKATIIADHPGRSGTILIPPCPSDRAPLPWPAAAVARPDAVTVPGTSAARTPRSPPVSPYHDNDPTEL